MNIINNYKFTIVLMAIGMNTPSFFSLILLGFLGYLIDNYCIYREKKAGKYKGSFIALKELRNLRFKDSYKALECKVLNKSREEIEQEIAKYNSEVSPSKQLFARFMGLALIFCIVASLAYTGTLAYMNKDNSIYRKNVREVVNSTQALTDAMGYVVPKINNIPAKENFRFYPEDKVRYIQHLYAVNWLLGIIEAILILIVMSPLNKMLNMAYNANGLKFQKKPLQSLVISSIFVFFIIKTEFLAPIELDVSPMLIPVFVMGLILFTTGVFSSSRQVLQTYFKKSSTVT